MRLLLRWLARTARRVSRRCGPCGTSWWNWIGLPTVVKGKEALGIRSVFELAQRPAYRVASPYSHPLQYPPYFIPGVPARMFYEPDEFEWSRPLVEVYPMILSELRQVLAADGKGFKAYVSEENRRLAGWNTFNFFFYGKRVEENCAQCPGTTAVLESLPRFERDHIMFSALNPGAHIPAHVGPINGIIRAHLGLAVPEGCYIKVGNQQRTWRAGRTAAFRRLVSARGVESQRRSAYRVVHELLAPVLQTRRDSGAGALSSARTSSRRSPGCTGTIRRSRGGTTRAGRGARVVFDDPTAIGLAGRTVMRRERQRVTEPESAATQIAIVGMACRLPGARRFRLLAEPVRRRRVDPSTVDRGDDRGRS